MQLEKKEVKLSLLSVDRKGQDNSTLVHMQSGLWSGPPLSIKLLTSEPWKEKINTSCQSFSCTTISPGQCEPFFWNGFIDALSLKSGSALPVRDCLLKFFSYWTMPPGHPEPRVLNTKGMEAVYSPPKHVSNSDSRSKVHKEL